MEIEGTIFVDGRFRQRVNEVFLVLVLVLVLAGGVLVLSLGLCDRLPVPGARQTS